MQMDILIIAPVSDMALEQIAAVDPRLNIIDARGWFEDEMLNTWPQFTIRRYFNDKTAYISQPGTLSDQTERAPRREMVEMV